MFSLHNSVGNNCTVIAKREIQVTFYSDDLKEVQSTAWSPVAVHVKFEKLCLNSFFEVESLKRGLWSSSGGGVFKFSFQQLDPRTAVLQDSEDVECSCCSIAAAVLELDPSNVQFAVAELEREAMAFVIVWSNPIDHISRVEYIFNWKLRVVSCVPNYTRLLQTSTF